MSNNHLLELGEEELPRIVLHPEQLRAVDTITSLIAELRTAKNDPALLYDMEASLFRARFRADEAWMSARRAVSRVERSDKRPGFPRPRAPEIVEFIAPPWRATCPLNSCDPGSWGEQERVAERISRQLAVVGDALAWRVFRYDRRVIIALASHPPTGPFVDSKGLSYEVGAILERRERGHLALMHDLTSVIRHVDMTEVHPDGFRELHEIKASAKASTTRQRRNAQTALDAASGAVPLPHGAGDQYIRRANVQMRTTVRDLADPIAVAGRDGTYIGYHADRVITVTDVEFIARCGSTRTVEEGVARHLHLTERRWPGSPRFNAFTADMATRDPALAPYSIYPLPASMCARLICDQVGIATTITFAALEHALRRPGAEVRTVANSETGLLEGGAPVLQIRHRDRGLTISMSAVRQLLLEFIDTKRWADAVWELIEMSDVPHAVLTFMNERATWA